MGKSVFEAIENGDTVTAEIVAEHAWGSALDNGSDIVGVDPQKHAKEEYEGYVEHVLLIYDDLLEGNVSDEEWSNLKEEASEIISDQKA